MATTRQRRVRAHREHSRAWYTERRRDTVAHQLERMDRFDAALAKVMAWGAIAMAVLIAVIVVVT